VIRAKVNDDGMSIVELLVYCILSIGLLLIVGSMIINGVRGQSSVTSMAAASNEAQRTASALQTDIRNASSIKVTTVGGDQLVVARVARGTDTVVAWKCVGWYYSSTRHEIRTTTAAGSITAPTGDTITSWKLLASGVEPSGSTVFAGDANHVAMTFKVTSGDTGPVVVDSSAYSRIQSGESTPCF
jgi:Tfp pilus assembly protein PilW